MPGKKTFPVLEHFVPRPPLIGHIAVDRGGNSVNNFAKAIEHTRERQATLRTLSDRFFYNFCVTPRDLLPTGDVHTHLGSHASDGHDVPGLGLGDG